MSALQIIVAIGFFILVIGAIFLFKEWVKTGVTLAAIGGILGLIGAIGHQVELDKDIPTAIDVYRGKTTLEITYRDSVAIQVMMNPLGRKWQRMLFWQPTSSFRN